MPRRALTANQPLLPAVRPGVTKEYLAEVPRYSVAQWTLGSGSVIWKIWPACLLHILFAVAIVCVNYFTPVSLDIPDVLLTVLGVVIGFVISYRASSGYDRYWAGRSTWSDIIKTTRTLSRLIHYHVPPRLSPKTQEEIRTGELKRSRDELVRCMKEKRMALDMVQGFAFSVKHYLRGELGIYYQDLYDLIKPLHDPADIDESDEDQDSDSIGSSTALPPHRIATSADPPHSTSSLFKAKGKQQQPPSRTPSPTPPSPKKVKSSIRQQTGERQPLLPGQLPRSKTAIVENEENPTFKLMPFGSFFSKIFAFFGNLFTTGQRGPIVTDRTIVGPKSGRRRWGGVVFPRVGAPKGAPRTTGTGETLPLEILRCLSEWISILEDRGTVPGTSLGSILGSIASLEGSLTQLEAILTTPLPFGYAVHIRHTVWIYLFFLPFEIVGSYGWLTIVAVAIASFIYLGFLAAGEEIEQPFGYDENDLDLDLFCREIIADEVNVLKRSRGLNVYFGDHHDHERPHRLERSQTLIESIHNDLSKSSLVHDGVEGTIENSAVSRTGTF